MTAPLRSPVTREPLRPDTPHSLSSGPERWPVVDGIAFLRTGRDALAAEALARLDAGDRDGALALLLADADDWWDGPRPLHTDLLRLVRDRDRLSLREAMALLAYGRVGDYFAHRWSDPTFVAGLALVEAHWTAPASAFELASGLGHNLRELARVGVRVAGADVVFSKLWLARHWVLGPDAKLVCFDAASDHWPVADRRADLVLCHDALYFLEPKDAIVRSLRTIAGPDGVLAIGHVHNREADNLSAGAAVTREEIEALFPDGVLYDDGELTDASVAGRIARAGQSADLGSVEAFSVAAGPGLSRSDPAEGERLFRPRVGTALRRNPLYGARQGAQVALAWPSERYRAEYAARATYPELSRWPDTVPAGPETLAAFRRRELVDLPERW